MNYHDTVNWMFAQLPMYQNKGKSAYKEDLSNTIVLASHLNNPETKFKAIHVAGTNGKGSTSHMLASILQESGYKVGLYTSPHLKDFRERIKINGKEISKQFVIDFINQNKVFFESNSLSFFEMTVGMAFDYFAKKKVDIAIIEVGLGGRLDSTNIINPILSIITNIGLDHIQFLGDSLEKIAVEKGGIIKDSIPVVIGETQEETKAIFQKLAITNNANIYFADQLPSRTFTSDLLGEYQKRNIQTAIISIKILRELGFKISKGNCKNGFNKVVKNTGILGRWQVIGENPKIVCDTAHNKEGLRLVLNQLQNESYIKLHLVLGFVNDKSIDNLIKLFPNNADFYFCQAKIERAINAEKLNKKFAEFGYSGDVFNSVTDALNQAKINASGQDLIFVGGSTFVVAEIL